MAARVPDTAIYKQIAADLREQILSGELPPGTRLGSEKELAHRYEVGIGSIRRVMTALRSEGLLAGEQGQVARVAEAPDERIVEVRASISPSIRSRRATLGERERLGISDGVWVIEVTYGGFSDVYPGPGTTVQIIPL